MNKIKSFFSRMFTTSKARLVIMLAAFAKTVVSRADDVNVDISAGRSALQNVTGQIGQYIPLVVSLCYALATIFAIVGSISVYIAMNNDEQDVKKIMMTVGACIFMIAAAQALPMFFGYSGTPDAGVVTP